MSHQDSVLLPVRVKPVRKWPRMQRYDKSDEEDEEGKSDGKSRRWIRINEVTKSSTAAIAVDDNNQSTRCCAGKPRFGRCGRGDPLLSVRRMAVEGLEAPTCRHADWSNVMY